MKSIITYGSKYGSAESYAVKLSEQTGISVRNFKDISDLSGYDRVIHFGGLYAGGVMGVKKIAKLLPEKCGFILVTVGIADTENEENKAGIRKSAESQISSQVMERTRIFNLRGAIDYSRLNFVHKGMMSMVYRNCMKIPPEQRSEEDNELIGTYGKAVSFVDFEALKQIEEIL